MSLHQSHSHRDKDLAFLVASTSMGTLIDGVGGRGFRVARRSRTESSLAMDKDRDQIETVLSSAKRAECDTD